MLRYLLKRVLQMVPLLIIISMITFGVSKLAPGDFLSARMADPSMTKERIEAERHRLGLDKPVPVQYVYWAGNFALGDMGESYRYRAPVSSLIGQRLQATLVLGLASLLLTWLVAVPLGIYAAVRNALNPMITILGYDIAGLLSGFALVEIIVGWPGLGQMMLEALQSFDMPLAMAGMMIGASMLLIGNLLADWLLGVVDPRIKLEA